MKIDVQMHLGSRGDKHRIELDLRTSAGEFIELSLPRAVFRGMVFDSMAKGIIVPSEITSAVQEAATVIVQYQKESS